jgi:cell division protein FtsL
MKMRRVRSFKVNVIPFILLILSLTLGCLLYVQARASLIRERYILRKAQIEKARLSEENSKLRLALATLSSPEELETVVRKQLGLRRPKPREVIVLK